MDLPKGIFWWESAVSRYDHNRRFFGNNPGICAYYIGSNLRKWGRINVTDCKEKFGSVRVYVIFGINGLHSIFYPGYHYYQKEYIRKIDGFLSTNKIAQIILQVVNFFVVPYQKMVYQIVYNKALYKFFPIFDKIYYFADEDIKLNKRSLKLYVRYLKRDREKIYNIQIERLLVRFRED